MEPSQSEGGGHSNKAPKYIAVDRDQFLLATLDVEALIPQDHRARAIWQMTGRLDFAQWEAGIASREGSAGRPCFSPRLLAAVWIYGYSMGVASARALARMTAWEPGLRWLCGCTEINAHTLSDFRVDGKERLDGLFTQLVAALWREGLIDLETVTQDGTKVQARSSKHSLHRRETLQSELAAARAHMEELDQQAQTDEAQDERKVAAQKRAAAQRVNRLEGALAELQKVAAEKRPDEQSEIRVSSSEPEARKMKHADGSWKPSHNVQVTTDSKEMVVVGVSVTEEGNDTHQLQPALEALEARLGQKPEKAMADGGYCTRENIEGMAAAGIELIGPLPDSSAREAGALARNGISKDFGRSLFVWDEATQSFVCPAGQRLEKVKTHRHHEQMREVYAAPGAVCAACAHVRQCCGKRIPQEHGRKIERVLESAAMRDFIRRMQQPDQQAQYKRRSVIAETPHMWWKGNWNWRRFAVFGRAKATMEVLWLAMAYNMQVWSRVIWRPKLQTALA
jgi:transposase